MTLLNRERTTTCLTALLVARMPAAIAQAQPQDKPVSGVFFAEKMEASPHLNAKGMAWWDGRLIIANRDPAKLYAFTPPDKFEVLKEDGLTDPHGVAVDPEGRLLLTENKDDVLYRLVWSFCTQTCQSWQTGELWSREEICHSSCGLTTWERLFPPTLV